MKADLNELTIEELTQGYSFDLKEKIYKCIFCNKTFIEGYIYENEDGLMTAKKAMEIHIQNEHNGVFNSLLSLEKDINGITEIQKKLLFAIFEKKDNKEIAKELEIAPSTVRAHKFYLQKMQREAKILLAILEAMEKESALANYVIDEKERLDGEKILSINSLHPFFTQYNLK